MLIFATVCVSGGEYSPDHVNKLLHMVSANIDDDVEGKFICFTDFEDGFDESIQRIEVPVDEKINGWWSKLFMFSRAFEPDDRIIYLDLDTVVSGGLDDIITCDAQFAICRDFYRPTGLQSCVMSWRGDFGPAEIYEPWCQAGRPHLVGGDQAWIESCLESGYLDPPAILQDLYPNQFVSYKVDCKLGLPQGAKVVCFHGKPRPWDVDDEWVKMIYHEGKTLGIELRNTFNEQIEHVHENIRVNSKRATVEWLKPCAAHDGVAVLVGGGPSLNRQLPILQALHSNNATFFALNNSAEWLQRNGISANYHVLLDARESNRRFLLADTSPQVLLASQCHTSLFDWVDNRFDKPPILWQQLISDIDTLMPSNPPAHCLIAAGSTVGLSAMAIAYALGYRRMHLFGYDSSVSPTHNHHAYLQPENDNQRLVEVTAAGKTFFAQPWMASQAAEFQIVASQLANAGVEISVHGDGLLPHIAHSMASIDARDGLVKHGDFWHPAGDVERLRYVQQDFADIEALLKHVEGRTSVVQAGGNVGIWPYALSEKFDEVHTFEPSEINYRAMQLNLGDCTKVQSYQAALSDVPGRAGLQEISENMGANYLCAGNNIECVRIDDVPLNACDLIVLDIEGHELKALKGAVRTIERFKPVICVEDKGLSERYGTRKGDVIEWLSGFGYQVVDEIGRDVVLKSNM